jgi:hypothetical protein
VKEEIREDLRFIRDRLREITINAVEALDEFAHHFVSDESLGELVATLYQRATMIHELSEQLVKLLDEIINKLQ